MKALRTTLAAVILFIGAMTVNAQSMSIAAMRSNARFLTDRMAYTLGISDPFVIDEIYRINYDYIWGIWTMWHWVTTTTTTWQWWLHAILHSAICSAQDSGTV